MRVRFIFVISIFVPSIDHENIFTTNISRFTVICDCLQVHLQVHFSAILAQRTICAYYNLRFVHGCGTGSTISHVHVHLRNHSLWIQNFALLGQSAKILNISIHKNGHFKIYEVGGPAAPLSKREHLKLTTSKSVSEGFGDPYTSKTNADITVH